MQSPRKSSPDFPAAELIVHRQQFTELTQFVSRVGNAPITDFQSAELERLLGNFSSCVSLLQSSYASSDPLIDVVSCLTSAHALHASHLNSKIEALSAPRPSARPGPDSELLPYLVSHLDLSDDVRTRKGLLREIQAKIVSSGPLLSSLVQTFRLPPDQTADSVIAALVEKMQLSERPQLRATIEQQRMEIERLREAASSPRSARRYHRCKAQVGRLTAAVDALSAQFERQAAELSDAAARQGALARASSELLAATAAQEAPGGAPGAPEVFAILEGIAVRGAGVVCRAELLDADAKARQLVDLVNDALGKAGPTDPQADTLRSVVYGLFRFLSNLSSGRELKTLIGPTSMESCRAFMVQQLMDLRDFLQEHAIGYCEDSCLFEEVLARRTTADLIDTVEKFVPRDSSNEELFLGLLQTIAANDVMRKFSADSLDMLGKQRRELKALRAAVAQFERKQESDGHKAQEQQDQALEEVVAGIRGRLRAAVLGDEGAVQSVLESLHDLDALVPLEDKEYIEMLERQVVELRALIGDTEARVEEARRELAHMQDDVKRVDERMAATQKENAAAREKADRARLEEQIAAQDAELSALRQQREELLTANERTGRQLSDAEALAKAALLELERTFEETKVDCYRLLELKEAQIKDLDGRVQYMRNRALERKRRFRAIVLSERNERIAVELQLRERRAEPPPQDFAILTDTIERMKGQAASLKKKLSVKERQHREEVEALQARIASAGVKANADAQAKIDQAVKSVSADAQAFLASFAQLFLAYSDGKPPQSLTAADVVLRRIKADIDRQPVLVRAKGVLDEVKAKLKPDKDVLAQIEELLKLAEERTEFLKVRQDMRTLTTWVEKIFRLYAREDPGALVDLTVMKQKIEELLHRKSRKLSSGRRTPMKHGKERSAESFAGFIFDP
jgi:hypothetical protein